MHFRLSPRDVRILKIIDREPDGATPNHVNSRLAEEPVESTIASLKFMENLKLIENRDSKYVLTAAGVKEIIKDRTIS